jgi:hypothetical protein
VLILSLFSLQLVLLNFATMSEGEEAASAAMIEHAPKAKARQASGYYGVSASGKRWYATIRCEH